VTALLKRRLDLVLSKRLGANYFVYFDNIFWLASEKAIQFLVALFVGAYVARYLGPGQYGLLGYAQSVISIALVVATLGIDNIVVRELVLNPTKRNDYLSAAAFLRFTTGMVFVSLTAIYWRLFASSDSGSLLILIMMLCVPLSAISVLALDLQAIVASKHVVFATTSQSLVGSLLRLLSTFAKLPTVMFAWLGTLDALLFGAILWRRHRSVTQPVQLCFPRLAILTLLLREGWPIFLSSVSVILYMRMAQIMLKAMHGDLETGIYIAAVRLSELWHFIPMVICSSIYPSLLRTRDTNPTNYVAKTQLLYDALFIVGLALTLLFTFLATPIIRILFGSDYLAAAPVLQVHIWSTIAVFLGVASGQWLLAESLQIVGLVTTIIGLATNFGLNLLLIPTYGAVGAATATSISYTVATFAGLMIFSRAHPAFRMLVKTLCFHWVWRR
jgi:O-antigen/teichoic acid export membrane protein